MKKARYIPITSKVNVLIIVALVAGIGTISFLFTQTITSTIDRSIENNLLQQSEILFAAVENFMMPGQAQLAVSFFDDMRQNQEYTINLFRTNRELAFSDTKTIEDVVARVPGLKQLFSNPSERMAGTQPVMQGYFDDAVGSPPQTVWFEETDSEQRISARIYKPLINLPKCTDCHGADHTVRGVIAIQDDITASRTRQRDSIFLAGSLFLGVVVVLAFILAIFMRRSIIKPIKVIGAVCSDVTNGVFDHKVKVTKKDEIGALGNTVNTMVEGLHERFELSKYVSSSTLESLGENKEGQKVSLTMLFSDVRGFTSYSDRHDPERVVHYLNATLNVQTEMIKNHSGDIDKYVGDEIVAMFSDENQELNACRVAWLIQKELTSNSEKNYDGLSVGIGINTGEVILGMIGSESRADYTFIGDNVNVASRLCDAAKPGQILISSDTYNKISDQLEVEGPFRMKAKGKDEYIQVYILKGVREET